MVSLDCEMVVCEDDQKEVVRVCAVGSDCQVRTYWSMQFQNVRIAVPLFALTPSPVLIVHTIELSRMVQVDRFIMSTFMWKIIWWVNHLR